RRQARADRAGLALGRTPVGAGWLLVRHALLLDWGTRRRGSGVARSRIGPAAQAPLAPAAGAPSGAAKRTTRVPPRRLAATTSSARSAWGSSTLRLYWPTLMSSSSPLRITSSSRRSAQG